MGYLHLTRKKKRNLAPSLKQSSLKQYGCAAAMAIAFISPLVPLNQLVTLAQVPAKPSSPVQRKSILESILAVFRRSLKPMGSRGTVCLLSPGVLEQKNIIWSDRPLFLWQGGARDLEVRPYSFGISYQEQPILWQQPNVSQSQPYTGESLQPGKTYQWQLSDPANQNRIVRTFQIMDALQRNQISKDLTTLATQLQIQGASQAEITINRAQYFSDQGLLSDALQELYSPDQGSTGLVQTVANMICPASTLTGQRRLLNNALTKT